MKQSEKKETVLERVKKSDEVKRQLTHRYNEIKIVNDFDVDELGDDEQRTN